MEWYEMRGSMIGDILRFVAPGTPLREGIENVLRANTGGLIVLGYNEKMQQLVDGGFHINSSFTPANLYELAKMDGALILNEEGSEIIYANAQLIPDPSIVSTETGMRHRTAERVAKQTGELVVAISQRRNVITLYKSNLRYSLKDIGVILTKANQAMQTLEKYKNVLDQGITNLGALEFEEMVTFSEVLQVMHRIEMVLRIKNEILNYVNELGTEGRLIQLQLTELVSNIEDEAALLIRDYSKRSDYEPYYMIRKLQEVTNNELVEDSHILKLLGYSASTKLEDPVIPRGYRILDKIPRLPSLIINHMVKKFGTLNEIVKASPKELVKVDGIGEVRASKIKEGLNRIQEQLFIDRHI
ncbi:DNA integrity scanning protein DisA [Pontibacillus yanchengensis]|uniref:DNA integrity scanning protein DisA n=2 Tax=Pontibacillus yanchengensis TaxID=462910 RepID=A0ACC7VLH8_9BACI|nr:DNA integrity scanning diadenylate cyclase DisA [Pontibacillus yanchengensis]MYL35918.1 DNA integrity scanning protein DisA [Pontibacillus yanchengensis]MYL55638.1 DNA integrity scanning protein DisA [Pontibacillus yanchengensis]